MMPAFRDPVLPGGKYHWTEVTTPVSLPGGAPRTLGLFMSGEVRLAWFRIDSAA
jgi:hypothetical protein